MTGIHVTRPTAKIMRAMDDVLYNLRDGEGYRHDGWTCTVQMLGGKLYLHMPYFTFTSLGISMRESDDVGLDNVLYEDVAAITITYTKD